MAAEVSFNFTLVRKDADTPSVAPSAIDIEVDGQSGKSTETLDKALSEYNCSNDYWNNTLTEEQRNAIKAKYKNVYITE